MRNGVTLYFFHRLITYYQSIKYRAKREAQASAQVLSVFLLIIMSL